MGAKGSGESVRVEGLGKLERDLRELELGLEVELRQVSKEAAGIVAREVKARAPIGGDGDPHPGRLRDSVRTGVTSRGASVRIGGASVPYAKPIVFGWPKRNIRPNPFPYTALDVRRGEVFALYETRVHELEVKAFGHGA